MRRRSRAGGEPVKTRHRKTAARKRGYAPKAVRPDSSSAPGQENIVARLTRELADSRRHLAEALEQQTAASEVLKVISSSPGELEPVFQTMLENATRICQAKFGNLWLRERETFRIAATHGAPPAYREYFDREPVVHPHPRSGLGIILETKRLIHIADIKTEPTFKDKMRIATIDFANGRSLVGVPLLKENEVVGVIAIYRQEVRPFTDKQIALVTNFAAQAVIAIENTRLLNELRESLDEQTATSEVLRVISSSPGELEPVFQAILENATRICEAKFGELDLFDGNAFCWAAQVGTPPQLSEFQRARRLFQPLPGGQMDRVMRTKQVIHTADDAAEAVPMPAARLGGARSTVSVPMLKEQTLIGIIHIYRQEVRPFTDKQIELLTNFAAQAVIAMENTRLLNELRQRTDDLSESLEQQTATSEVLKVISSSPGDLEPVFNAMLANATRICEATIGTLYLYEGTNFRGVALHHSKQSYVDYWQRYPVIEMKKSSEVPLERLVNTKQVVHIPDLRTDQSYLAKNERIVALADVGGVRTFVAVPMLKEGELIGSINMYRQEVRPFTGKQIELVQNFAAQAVIAIENTRLLNELRQRTDDLTESLEQQTATSEVLKVISSSPGELEPVFLAMLESATRICEARFGTLFRFDGDMYHLAAQFGTPPDLVAFQRQRGPFRPPPDLDEITRTKRTRHTADAAADPNPGKAATLGGARSAMYVPMVKHDHLVGALVIYRQEVRPFTDKQIELVENFAAQAVIAIENTRLLSELRQSLQQQTATADVLKIISRSTFDLKSVLNTLVESAARLCEADMASVPRVTGGILDYFASYGYSPGFHEFLRNNPTSPGRGTVSGRAVLEGRTVHIPDVLVDPEYDYGEGQKIGGYRTLLGVPLMREGAAVGALLLGRAAPRPFTPQQIELLETFADQAVIAIENVRLFDEIQDKSRQLEIASQHKSQFLANMSHELRTPLNAILGYTELMADGAYGEPSEKMLGVLQRLESNGKHLLGLINDVLDLSKIEAGQLVLDLSDYTVQDIAQTVRSTLEPLAADKKLAFKLEFAPELPAGHGDGRRLNSGPDKSGRQRHQVHRCRRSRHQGRSEQWLIPCIGSRYRPWHICGRSSQAVSGVPAGRQCYHQEERRDRLGARYIEAHH